MPQWRGEKTKTNTTRNLFHALDFFVRSLNEILD